MAGPLSSEEIEDVVSSVRRLVSNEQRPRTLSRDLNSERLLLTPALRVVPETSPLAPLVLNTPLANVAPEVISVAPEMALEEDTLPERSALLDLSPQGPDGRSDVLETEAQPDLVLDTAEMPDPARAVDVETEVEIEDVEEVATVVEVEATNSAWEDKIWTAPVLVPLGEAALLADEAEVLTAPMADPDQSEAEEAAAPWVEAPADFGDGEPVPFVPLRRRAEQFAARLASTNELADPATPDATPADMASAEAERAAESIPPAPAQRTVFDAPQGSKVATELLDEDGTPLAVLDETALTEIVRQVLRAELQGDLGERITRNVRKLVRAEINRALIARDLD
jgi:hypothetical protein